MQNVTNQFDDILQATNDFIDQYKDKQFLWKETLEESFEQFLSTGTDPREEKHVKTNADGEEEEDETFKWMAEKILVGVKTKRPDLDAFDEKISFLTDIKNDINQMQSTVDIGWLRVNATPFIKELQNTITLWINTYISFLMDNTVQQLKNIEAFNTEITEGIKELPKGTASKLENDTLMKVMTHLRDVKMIKDRTLAQIEPMKQTVMLLKKHQLKMDEDYLVKLENSKTALVDVSEKALGPIKEAILPL